ncbi:Type IV secretion-system coupling protein DNA-binding domain-containing protein, partial [Prauserella aidingensis]|uniref:type IV secretion system DNA-binding domain-containing protein n=1 Tax=Prauserella aidingensis TaxID=387890 RepID=UPI0020A54DCB
MEITEHRKRKRDKQRSLTAGGVGFLAAADMGIYDKVGLDQTLCEMSVGAILPMPWDGAWTVIAASVATIAGTAAARARRNTDAYKIRENLHRRDWATLEDRRHRIGLSAARRRARGPRANLSRWQRRTAPAAEVGIPVGKTVSGPRFSRGRQAVLPWEDAGLLIIGSQGRRKSTALKGMVAGVPGSAVVVSTKDEFIRDCGGATLAKGPNYAFTPNGTIALPDNVAPFRHNLIRGCWDSTTAQRRAQAIIEATGNSGVSNAEFWATKSRQVVAGLLQAADLGGRPLSDVVTWLNTGMSDAEAILAAHRDKVERATIEAVQSMTRDGDRTAQSVGHTATAAFEFMQNTTVAASLDAAPDDCVDLASFVRSRSTLYMVTGDDLPLSPALAVLWSDLVDAAKRVAVEDAKPGGEQRLDPPLVLAVDECDVTMPGVDLSVPVAKHRGFPGVFTIAVTQNRDRLVQSLGKERAAALCETFVHHLVLGVDSVEDREYYEKRARRREAEVVKNSTSAPDSVRHRMMGNPMRVGHTSSESTDLQTVPLWSGDMWG